ncbi:MAG: hypothetical protein LBU40_05520, partial [Methanobrevibacter sp.]|nr:hypothetical protein [Methanobrevibacter sp.]
VNNTNSINISNINGTENNTNNSTNEMPLAKNTKNSNIPLKKNQPNNIPKNSKLSYSKAYNRADSFKGSDSGPYMETYVKYKGYMYDKGYLYWKFEMYAKKDNMPLGEFRVKDATGEIDLY